MFSRCRETAKLQSCAIDRGRCSLPPPAASIMWAVHQRPSWWPTTFLAFFQLKDTLSLFYFYLIYFFESRIHCEPRLISTCLSSASACRVLGFQVCLPCLGTVSLTWRQQLFSGQLALTLQAIFYCFTGPGPG